MKRNNKGYTIMFDALVALLFMLIITTTIYNLSFSRNAKTDVMSFKELHYVSEDVVDVLNKKGILDNVSTYWAANSTPGSDEMEAANRTAKEYLEEMLPHSVGYRLTIDEGASTSTITESNSSRPSMEDSSTSTHSTRILVGFSSGMPTYSYVSRASLSAVSNAEGSEYVYFGGFVGQGNITRFVTVPDDATFPQPSYMEIDAGSGFNLLVNGAACGGPYGGGIVQANLVGCNFIPGENNLTFKFTTSNNNFIGGGYVRVNYRSDEWNRAPDFQRYWFPGINGLINLYSGFYVPSSIQRMVIHLKYKNDIEVSPGVGASMFLNIAGKEVYRSNALGEVTVDLDTDAGEIFGVWGGWAPFQNALSTKTIPVRFGTETFTISTTQKSTADAIIITDVSGSMAHFDVPCSEQIPADSSLYDCEDSGVYYRDKINVAREVDKVFVTTALDYSGMRVGLVKYNDVSPLGISPNVDEEDLNDTIDGYTAGGSTCICCGINRARTLIQDPYVAISWGDTWRVHNTNKNCQDSCNPSTIPNPCQVSDWEKPSEPTSATFSNALTPYTDNNGRRVVYFRKNFTVDYPSSGDGTLRVMHQGGVECYLNGHSVGFNDGATTGCTAATTDTWSVPKSYFLLGQNLLACRVRSRNGYSLIFNASLTYPRNKAMLVMSDGQANQYCRDATSMGKYNNFASQGGDVPNAIADAINSACYARDNYNVSIYAVGFGSTVDVDTLKKIACWNCSANTWLPGKSAANCPNFYLSNDADDLEGIYGDIASTIGSTSMQDQNIIVTGGSVSMGNVLDPSSYIQFNVSVPPVLEYGETMLPLESSTLAASGLGSFNVPATAARILDVKVTSYSGQYWTKTLQINSTNTGGVWDTVYNLTTYGTNYALLGDPYFVNIPVNKVATGKNSVNLTVGGSPTTNVATSTADKVLFKIALKALTGYSAPKKLSEGCNWTVEFFDNTKVNISAPSGYIGPLHCNYTNSARKYDKNSSVDEAVYVLFSQLDINGDGRLDSKFDPADIFIVTTTVGGVRSLWGPIRVKLTLWM